MRVRMDVQISGTRDGQDWPAPGEEIDVTDVEAKDLIATGQASDPGKPVSNPVAASGEKAAPHEPVGVAHGQFPDEHGRTGDKLTTEQVQAADAPRGAVPAVEAATADADERATSPRRSR